MKTVLSEQNNANFTRRTCQTATSTPTAAVQTSAANIQAPVAVQATLAGDIACSSTATSSVSVHRIQPPNPVVHHSIDFRHSADQGLTPTNVRLAPVEGVTEPAIRRDALDTMTQQEKVTHSDKVHHHHQPVVHNIHTSPNGTAVTQHVPYTAVGIEPKVALEPSSSVPLVKMPRSRKSAKETACNTPTSADTTAPSSSSHVENCGGNEESVCSVGKVPKQQYPHDGVGCLATSDSYSFSAAPHATGTRRNTQPNTPHHIAVESTVPSDTSEIDMGGDSGANVPPPPTLQGTQKICNPSSHSTRSSSQPVHPSSQPTHLSSQDTSHVSSSHHPTRTSHSHPTHPPSHSTRSSSSSPRDIAIAPVNSSLDNPGAISPATDAITPRPTTLSQNSVASTVVTSPTYPPQPMEQSGSAASHRSKQQSLSSSSSIADNSTPPSLKVKKHTALNSSSPSQQTRSAFSRKSSSQKNSPPPSDPNSQSAYSSDSNSQSLTSGISLLRN